MPSNSKTAFAAVMNVGTVRFAALASLLLLAACGGGGGGTSTGSVTTPTTPIVTTPIVTPPAQSKDYEIQPPPAPSSGGAAPLLATRATPNFSTPPAPGTAFPLIISVVNNQGLIPDSKPTLTPVATSGATLTIVSNLTNVDSFLRLQVPSMGIDVSGMLYSHSTAEGPAGDRVSLNLNRMSYAVWGAWGYVPAGVPTDGTQINNRQGVAVGGYQTPIAGMPTSGSASYSMVGGVQGEEFARSNDFAVAPMGYITNPSVSGDVALTVDFASGKLTGTFDHLVFDTSGVYRSKTWNNISLTGTISGATFGGATSALDASGSFAGAFYGPTAQEAAGAWTLYPADGSVAVIGAFGAKKN